MKILGCTGGIGSGKSYVCRIFSSMGIPVYDSDTKTKQLYEKDASLLAELAKLAGAHILNPDKSLNKKALAAAIFSSKELMQEVKDLVYPVLMEDFNCWKNTFESKNVSEKGIISVPFAIMESAVILESPVVLKAMDKVLTVSAPDNVRIERVLKRNGGTRIDVIKRINSQMNDLARKGLSDFVIVSGRDTAILPQVERVYEDMCRLSGYKV